jgi:hypothetical protein
MRYILFSGQRRYIVLPTSGSKTMQTSIRRWHRMVAERIAESAWLRDRAGANASWTHYEWHARARLRAGRLHAKGRDRGRRLARHGPPTVAAGWQATIARLAGHRIDDERPGE